jgi:hypothetical protein
MKYLICATALLFSTSAFAAAEQACKDEIRARVLEAASALTAGTSVSDFKNLKASGKTVKTKSGETLNEYTLTDLTTEDGWIPDSSASVYVKKDGSNCSVIRVNINLR